VDGKFSCIADIGEKTLVMTQSFDSLRTAVFDAWTMAEQVALWWDPTGAKLAVCEIDLRPNGDFRWINQGDVGLKYQFAGTYCEIVRPERLVFRAGMAASPRSLTTLIFREAACKTTLTMTIECPTVAQRDEMLAMRVDTGTARTLQNLAQHLERKK
jgi:uncharacterized protein YndB with AHSA1/START domain